MTHDELLAKVKQIESFASYDPFQNAIRALRTIIELHKPNECSHGNGCLECGGMECATGYPCPTVQAIEKELR